MKANNTIKYHLLLAFILIGMHVFDQYSRMGHEVFMEKITLGAVYIFTYHVAFFGVYILNYSLICPNTIPKKKLFHFFLGQIILCFVFAGIRYFMEEIVVYHIGGFHNYSDHTRKFWFYIFDNLYYALKAILFSGFMYILFTYLRSISKIHRLEIEHKKAELDVLKTQLEPHFLFNTLNVFYSELAETQPETAKGIHKLSELLRYLTYEIQKDFTTLDKEIKFIKDYIYFYEKRFENNLFLNLTIDGEIKEQKIPSLVFIHFIENIFKHGIINSSDCPAEITIQVNQEYLTLETKNKISNVKNYSTQGIGKENLKKRLRLLFENNYEFTQKELDNIYTTYLRIPLKF